MKFDTKDIVVQNEDANGMNNLIIGLDYDEDPAIVHASVLFTPLMSDTNHHHHIRIEDDASIRLYNWLKDYLTNKELI